MSTNGGGGGGGGGGGVGKQIHEAQSLKVSHKKKSLSNTAFYNETLLKSFNVFWRF